MCDNTKAYELDSINNYSKIKQINKMLEFDSIARFSQIRVIDKNHIQYLTSSTGNVFTSFECDAWLLSIKNDNTNGQYYYENSNGLTKKKQIHDCTIFFERQLFTSIVMPFIFSKAIDYFIFDINFKKYNSLNELEKQILLKKLEKYVLLIYHSTALKKSIKLNNNKFINNAECLINRAQSQFIPNIFQQADLTLKDVINLRVISILGSSKEVSRIVNLSHRTIEKIIEKYIKRLNVFNKSQLQILTRLYLDYINPVVFEINWKEL